MSFPNRVGNSNPGYLERLAMRELEAKVKALESIVASLVKKIDGGVEAKTEVVALADLKITELKKLCENNGIDFSEFGNTKAPYVKALTEKGL